MSYAEQERFGLDERSASGEGLPDALRVLVKELPEETWRNHPEFSGLIRFWLQRHMGFRALLDRMEKQAQSALDKNMAPLDYARNLAHHGGQFVQGLHGHHHIEDDHYFPLICKLDQRVERGFDILDKDHDALELHLDAFASTANGVLSGFNPGNEVPTQFIDQTAKMHREILGLKTLLNRHLIDEEELVVPVLLKHAPPELR